jgi:hypothetical protein
MNIYTTDGERTIAFTDAETDVLRGALIAYISSAMGIHAQEEKAGRTESAVEWLAEVKTAEALVIRL